MKISVSVRAIMPNPSDSARWNGNSAEERLDLTLETRVESVDLAVSLIEKFSEEACTQQQREQIELAVREAMANALLHGNQFDPKKKVHLSAEMRPHGLVITIRDEGKGCEPESVPDPLESENLLRDSGRGMFLMRACMDEVIWRRAACGGMELIMTKRHAEAHGRHQMSLTVRNRQRDGVTVIDLNGRLVLGEESKMLREELKNLASQGRNKILLNLAGVSYIDSSGLGALIGGFTTVTSQHGQLKLLNLTKSVHDLLQLTKLLTVFEVHTDEAAAVRSFR
jgi:anti-anti-sigma factor